MHRYLYCTFWQRFVSIQILTQEDHQKHSFVIDETILANGHGGPAGALPPDRVVPILACL